MQVLSPVSSRSPSPISDADTDPGSFNYLSIPVTTAPSLTEVSPIWDRRRVRSPSMERSNSERSLSPPEMIDISPPSSANSTKAPSPTPAQSRVFSPSVGPASVPCSPASPSLANSLRSLSPYVGPRSPVIRSIAPSPVGSAPQSPASNGTRNILYSTHSSMNSPALAHHRLADPTKIPVALESACYGLNSGRPLTPPSEPISDRALAQGSPYFPPVSERSLTPPPEPIPYRTPRCSIQPVPYRTWRCSNTKTQDNMPRPAFVGPSGGNKPIRNPWGPPPPASHFEPSSPLSQTVSPSTSSAADSYFPCSPGLFGPRTPLPAPSPDFLFGPRSPVSSPPVPVPAPTHWGTALPTPPPAGYPASNRPWVIPQQVSNLKAPPPRRVPVSEPPRRVPVSGYPMANMCIPPPTNIADFNAYASSAGGVYNEMYGRPQPFKNHERFYFPDGTAWIRVKNVDYRVHRHFLTQHSSFFRTQYDGMYGYSTHASPLSLPLIDTAAFDLILSIFYPKDPFSGHDIQTPAQWAQVLCFACEYDMPSIREMALSKVAGLSALQRVDLAKEYKLKEIMVPSFVDLYMEDVELSKEDGKKIGWEGFLVLADVKREVESNLKAFLDRGKVAEAVEKKLGEMGLLD